MIRNKICKMEKYVSGAFSCTVPPYGPPATLAHSRCHWVGDNHQTCVALGCGCPVDGASGRDTRSAQLTRLAPSKMMSKPAALLAACLRAAADAPLFDAILPPSPLPRIRPLCPPGPIGVSFLFY